MANINDATSAYSNALKQVKGSTGADAAQSTGPGFGDLLKDSLQNAADIQHKSEAMSGAALAGKADMTDVLQAITDAELALNTVLAVRDKVVQAYEQVMHTPM